ncbi:YfiR family protein [Microbulbifer taiwanensis]|uniref:YfiR family protein n=1 Tax=Microbulbifer taiwanensis TaxID=986746 RepID=A0ABW1YKJ3_9GAMM|nr:YfiR family protein [Microbulbifer taiwanensis]
MNNRQFHYFLNNLALLISHLAVLLVVVMATSAQASAQLSGSETGRRVMVDYIVHFAYHLQWPIQAFTGADAPFRICVMGGDSLSVPLAERLKHQRINGRPVALESVSQGEPMRARSCQIVVLGEMERSNLLKAVGALEFFPVLTVSDAERFAVTGGMIEFTGKGDSVSLQLNKTMLDRAELKVGNSLFRLSREVD